MKKFNPAELQPGDILLFRTTKHSPFHSKLIAIMQWLVGEKQTKHNYHHVAMIDFDNTLVLEAVWKGTILHPVSKIGHTGKIEVYRVRNVTDQQIQIAVEYARNNLGKRYDFINLLLGWAGIDSKRAEICSTFVGKSWAAAGIQLTKKAKEKIYSPDDIAANKKVLKRVM